MINDDGKSLNAENEIALWNIIKLLLRKCYWILLSGAIFGLIVYFIVTFYITPTYESRTSFYVYNTSNSSFIDIINTNDLQAAESLAESYSKILESNSVLDAVLSNLVDHADLTRKDLSKMVEVSIVPNTQLLEVLVSSDDPQLACEVADSFVEAAPAEIERITKAGSLEVVDRPEVASEKSAPRTLFDTAIGFVIGAILSAVIILWRSFSDRTIYLPDDVMKAANVTVLGQIPVIKTSENKHFGWHLEDGEVIRSEYEKKESQTTDNGQQNGDKQEQPFGQ